MCGTFNKRGWPSIFTALAALVASLSLPARVWAQEAQENWKSAVQQNVSAKNLAIAQLLVERRIAESPTDLEAHGWRARLLAWQGHWPESEAEYRMVLERAPWDTEVLLGLSDVLAWQQKWDEALQVLDEARRIQPGNIEVLIRRARVLSSMGHAKDARAEFRHVLALDPSNVRAKNALNGMAESNTHQLRFGTDIDSFNYTGMAQAYGASLDSHWSKRWSTLFAWTLYDRFAQTATKFSVSTAYRVTTADWVSVGGAGGHDNGVIPRSEASIEYGHGFHLHNTWFRGLESSYQGHWLWFRDARVFTLNSTQLLYLPREWTWMVSGTAAHSTFPGRGSEWRPAGTAKLSFPLHRRLTGNTFVAVGSENFALIDQIGSFSARTLGGGARWRLNATQDISGYLAWQDRSTGHTQTSYGVSYGIRF